MNTAASADSGPFEHLVYERRRRVAFVELNRPASRNALATQTMEELDRAVARADRDDRVHVLVIKGAGTSFCAGYDLQSRPEELFDTPASHEGDPGWSDLYTIHDTQRRNGEWWLKVLFNLRKPVIAQVHGHCVAGGLDLLGVCDLAVAAEDATFGLPQARGLGVIHTMGLLPLLVGLRKSKELAFTGDPIDGVEAARLGLVNKAVPREDLDAEVVWLAERVSYMPKELLLAHKFAINRFYELMGIDTAVKSAGEYDALATQNLMLDEFRQIAREQGMKAALAWRDRPWKTQPPPGATSDHDGV